MLHSLVTAPKITALTNSLSCARSLSLSLPHTHSRTHQVQQLKTVHDSFRSLKKWDNRAGIARATAPSASATNGDTTAMLRTASEMSSEAMIPDIHSRTNTSDEGLNCAAICASRCSSRSCCSVVFASFLLAVAIPCTCAGLPFPVRTRVWRGVLFTLPSPRRRRTSAGGARRMFEKVSQTV